MKASTYARTERAPAVRTKTKFSLKKITIDYKGIALCLVGILLGRTVTVPFLATLGIAYSTVFFGTGVNFYFVSAAVAAGMLTVSLGAWKYILAVFIMSAANFIVTKKSIKLTHIHAAFICAFAIITSAVLTSVFNGVTVYLFTISALESILALTLSFIFNRSSDIFYGIKKAKKHQNEELISLSIIFAGAICGMSGVTVAGFVLRDFFGFGITLFFAFSGGTAVGAISGVLVGLVLTLSGGGMYLVAVLGIAGICCGFLRDLGRLITTIAFAICVFGVILYYDFSVVSMSLIVTISISSVVFLVMPKKYFTRFAQLINMEKNYVDYEYANRIKTMTTDNLSKVSDSFEKLAKTLDVLSEKKNNLSQTQISALIDETAAKVCTDCGLAKSCWESNFYVTYQAIFSILSACEKKGKTTVDDIPLNFYGTCCNLNKFVDTTNRTFELYKHNMKWENKVNEARYLVCQQLLGMSFIMKKLQSELETELRFKTDLETVLLREFNKNSLEVTSVIVLENKLGKYEVNLTHSSCGGMKTCTNDFLPIISKALGRNMKAASASCLYLERRQCKLKFIEEQRFKVSCGVAKVSRDIGNVSGDSYSFMELKDGKCLLALSDGMGTGKRAGEESAASIELLEQFMETGFEQSIAVKMINSVLVLKSGDESFTTLDICVIDLHSGFSQFAKVGAAETFLYRDGEVSVIRSKSLPVGILTEIDIENTTKKLIEGDILVMTTDGITDSDTDTAWIESSLKTCKSNNPQDIADYILHEAKKNYKNNIKDDMTVLAARLWKLYA